MCYTMFYSCDQIIEMDLSHFNSSEVINMGYMFDNCEKLYKIDLSGFDTSLVTDMYL